MKKRCPKFLVLLTRLILHLKNARQREATNDNMSKKETYIKHAKYLSAYLLLVWVLYRIFFRFPEEIEELFIKPLVWLLPLFFLLRKEKLGVSSLGITTKNIFSSTYFVLALGIGFALEGVVINVIKYGGISFSANLGQATFLTLFGLSLATAFVEETVFRGYLFNRVCKATGNERFANLSTSLVWGLLHLPIAVLWWKVGFAQALGYFILITIFGIGSSFVFARTQNVISSILLHVFWSWPIILFR